MLRATVIASGCAMELTLSASLPDGVLWGLPAGGLTLLISLWNVYSSARRISREIAGLDLPTVLALTEPLPGQDAV